MNEAVREMTFEEEASLYEKEARALFDKETPGYEAPPINHTVRRGMRIIRKAREEIERLEKRMQWISVEERLPEKNETVLCADRSGVFIGSPGGVQCGMAAFCTHWMPLPDLPNKEDT